MGEASKFTDAKVIRSDDTTLLLEELRLLYRSLEAGDTDMQDVKRLMSIGPKLEETMGNYYSRIEAATAAHKQAVLSGADEQIATNALNLLVAQLDTQLGQELSADTIVTITEWQWMMDRWKKNAKFNNTVKETRFKLARIEDALTNAKGVKFVGKSKAIWIEGEPEPLHQHEAAS